MRETKEHILKVSFGLFLKKSFKEVTMKEIVEKTGMSKGAFYHYFSSKEQIFFEIINNAFSEILYIDFDQFSNDSLNAFYHEYIDYMHRVYATFQNIVGAKDSFGLNYYSFIFDAIRLFPDFREDMVEANRKEFEVWVRIIHVAKEKMEIQSSMSDEQIAQIFVNTTSGVGMNNIVLGLGEETPQALLNLWDGFYAQLKK